jgi:hypothetical protein
MEWTDIDWHALERLRTAFLDGSAGHHDYWKSERDLASYDLTFAQRIGWKWDHVLSELRRRGWTPPPGEVVDWACGSGIAGRAYLDHFGPANNTALRLWDRSALARHYAKTKAEEKYRDLPVRFYGGEESRCGTLLLSHVLTELTSEQTEQVITLARLATAVLWVEPGTHEASRLLSRLREQLRAEFNLVAPCPHQSSCPMLAPENAVHWCHHFAPTPPEVFTDGNWARFAALAGVDLRSLPLSFLVLDKRPVPTLPAHAVRVIGHPRVYKAHALLLGCSSDGLRERRLSKRILADEFRRLKKSDVDPLQLWECGEGEITRIVTLI